MGSPCCRPSECASDSEPRLFVIFAGPDHAHLVGRRILEVGGTGVERAFELLEPLIPRDNSGSDLLGRYPFYLINPTLLQGVGMIQGTDRVELLVSDASGAGATLERVDPTPTESFAPIATRGFDLLMRPEPLYLRSLTENFWFTFLPDASRAR